MVPGQALPQRHLRHTVVALAEIVWALTEDRIDTKRASLILYMLRQASTNLNRTSRCEGQREAVPPLVLSVPSPINFEKRYDLSPNIDLNPGPRTHFL